MKGFIFLFAFILATEVEAQKWEWAYDGGASFGTAGIANDYSGNVYVLLNGISSNYGVFPLHCGAGGLIIAKHDTNGNVIWAEQIMGASPSSISFDKLGNIYLTGTCKNATFCGQNTSFSLAPLGNYSDNGDAFIAKYDPNGNIIWAKLWGFANSDDSGNAIKTDLNGYSVITGRCLQSPQQGGLSNYFVQQYDSQGNLLWSKTSNWQGGQYPNSLDIDEDGNSYVTGIFGSSSAFFDNITLTTNTNLSIFIAKYDKNGNLLWANKAGSGYDGVGGICLDHKGNFYLTGGHGYATTFGNVTLSNKGIFVIKFDTSGVALWGRSASSTAPGGIGGVAVACDRDGSAFVTGYMRNTTTFSDGVTPITLSTPKTNFDIFVAKYDSTGNIKWAVTPGGSVASGNSVSGLSVFNNSCFITGIYSSVTIFGNSTLNSSGMFVAKIKDTIASLPTRIKSQTAEKINFNIYPNPTEKILNISYKGSTIRKLDLKVLTITGQCIYYKSFNDFNNGITVTLDLGEYSKGVYFIEMSSDEKKEVKMALLE